EWVHVQLHQQKGMISLSPPTICNSARRTPSPRQFSPSMPTTSGGKFSTLTATMLNFMEKCVGEIAGRQS
ncbi:hypothetical protein NSP77_25555, partial [Salmonella enterica]|nr:hypothetical protein [Salmonella enterica]